MFLSLLLLILTADTTAPVLFAPGQVPTTAFYVLAPAFTPDGRTVYFFQGSPNGGDSIMCSTREATGWSTPRVAPFSGWSRDLEPAFSPDGRYLVFASSRPQNAGDSAVSGFYNGQVLPGKGGRLWKVTRQSDGWGAPEMLPVQVNANTSLFSPAVAGDGSLYFMRADSGKLFHIYRSAMKDGVLQTPVALPFIQADHGDYDPAVSSDESFLIFSSDRPPSPPHTADIFIVFRTPGGWGDPIDLRQALSSEYVHGVECRLSPDDKTLYFSNGARDGRYGIWQVDITPLLKTHAD